MRLLVLVGLLSSVLGSEDVFLSFTQTFNKSYKNHKEMITRREVFLENYQEMVDHNTRYEGGDESWTKKVYADMDLTAEEWLGKRTGLPAFHERTVLHDALDHRIVTQMEDVKDVPEEFSWLSQGAISSAKDQIRCGSCAVFATIAAIESCSFIQTGVLPEDLSEQHLLDCAFNHEYNDESGAWGAHGCDGGWPPAYLDWVIVNGQYNQEETSYPYFSGIFGYIGPCSPDDNGYNYNFRVTGMYNKWYTEEDDMRSLVLINPVVTAVQATGRWSGYSHGVLEDKNYCCNADTDPQCIHKLNHAVLVVGYGHDEESGLDYWLIKNSWGDSWGEDGFLKLKRGTGHCGVGALHQTIPYCAAAEQK